MYILFSGEGPTDLGVAVGDNTEVYEGDQFKCGPLAIMVDQMVAARFKYSLIDAWCCGYIKKQQLKERVAGFRSSKKAAQLWGKKRPQETIYFYRNARALALYAKDKQKERNEKVVAILFRDSDDSASAERAIWNHKRDSILKGFDEETFATGIPMVPKPTSEAWIIAGMTGDSSRGGRSLEHWHGKTNSPNSLKGELETMLGEKPTSEKLCQMTSDQEIDHTKIHLPSFDAFRDRLTEVI
jgi:hypothetical protein